MIPKGSLKNIYFALKDLLACIYSCFSLSLLNMYFIFLMSHQTNMIFMHVWCCVQIVYFLWKLNNWNNFSDVLSTHSGCLWHWHRWRDAWGGSSPARGAPCLPQQPALSSPPASLCWCPHPRTPARPSLSDIFYKSWIENMNQETESHLCISQTWCNDQRSLAMLVHLIDIVPRADQLLHLTVNMWNLK